MSVQTTSPDESPCQSTVEQIDHVRDLFANDWRAGSAPRIENFLDGSEGDDAERSALFLALLGVELEHRRSRGERPSAGDYRARFPEYHALIAEAFCDATTRPAGRRKGPSLGRDLLFGMLALQNNFVGRDALLAGFGVWVADKSKSLASILTASGAISPARRDLLNALTDEHLGQHGGDAEQSLGALSSAMAEFELLYEINDPEVRTNLGLIPTERFVGQRSDLTTEPMSGGPGVAPGGGRFRVLHLHRVGGMGKVSVAKDEELNREVALKEIKDRDADDLASRSRLVLEAEITGGLEHPGIVPVYGLGRYDNGRPFYAMRLIRDDNLGEAIKKFHRAGAPVSDPTDRALALRDLLGRFIDICDTIDYAHHRGVLNRDLKPGNVMLGRYGETLVLDWGLAELIDRVVEPDGLDERTLRPQSASGTDQTRHGRPEGTFGYMPPEQATGRPDQFTPACDVYSLGAILYTVLTNRVSVKPAGPSDEDKLKAIRDIETGNFPRPRALNPKAPLALEAICLKAMATKPLDRYPSPRALGVDVKHWLADEPVSVYREPAGQRLSRWARRNRAWVQSGVASLVVVAVVAAVLARSERAARAEAVQNYRTAREALYQIVDVTGSRLAYVRGTELVARKALAFSETFLQSQPNDLGVRFDRARILRATANIGRMNGRFEEALPLYRDAAGLLDRLAAEDPGNASVVDERVLNTIDTGELIRLEGRPNESKAYFRSALALLEAGRHSEGPASRRLKSIALTALANAQNETGHYDQARVSGNEAIALLEPLAGGGVDHPDDSRLLLIAQRASGVAERELKNRSRSETLFGLAIRRAELLVSAGHDSPNVKHALASALNERGLLLEPDPSARAEAERMFQEAGFILCALVNEYGHIPQFQRDLAIAYNGVGGARTATGLEKVASDPAKAKERLDNARTNCDEARRLLVDLLRARDPYDYHSHLARTLTNLSRIASTRGETEAARELSAQALIEHKSAIAVNPESRVDVELLEKLRAGQPTPK